MVRSSVFLVIIILCSSCKILKSFNELKKNEATVYHYQYNSKEIIYLPMHHLGKPEFFDDVKNKIADYKSNGFIVYYELITTNFESDSIQRDLIRRKARKIKGFSGDYAEVVKGSSMFEKYVIQPAYSELGTDSNDVRADVNYLQLINQWELENGFIELDSIDLNTPFDQKFEKGTFYSKKQYDKIIIEFRNQFLIKLIHSSPDNKILLLYGEGHRKHFARNLN